MILLSTQGEIIADKYLKGYLVRQLNSRINKSEKKPKGTVTIKGYTFDLGECFRPIEEMAHELYRMKTQPYKRK